MIHWLKMLRPIQVFLFILCLEVSANPNTTSFIHGKLELDSSWASVLYLSHIPSFENLYSMSGNMIVEKTQINAKGEFSISTKFLPEKEQLYRIHISKEGDPPATLAIGGSDENHMFIIASRSSGLKIIGNRSYSIFRNIEIQESTANQTLFEIHKILGYLDSSGFNSAELKREFITSAIHEKLRFIADTTSNPLVALYALHRSDFESDIALNPEYYEAFSEKWAKENSTYFKSFRAQVPITADKESLYRIWIAIGFLLLGLVLGQWKRIKRPKKDPIRSLSVQERKIFQMLQQGHSNKDISDELSIGLSTVKSHVSNIYTKLGISSRKEVMNIQI
jgi:DNA-binding CsgD family transcriptional regulator